jgi:hypothetical protein
VGEDDEEEDADEVAEVCMGGPPDDLRISKSENGVATAAVGDGCAPGTLTEGVGAGPAIAVGVAGVEAVAEAEDELSAALKADAAASAAAGEAEAAW